MAAAAAFGLVALLAAGCGNSEKSGGGGKQVTVAGVSILVGDPYFVTIKCGAIDAAKQLGVKLLWDGSTSADVAPQAAILKAMELKEPDGFVFTPFSQDAYLADVKRLMAAGKPVVLADATMAQNVFYEGYQSDNELAGQQVADFLAKVTGGQGSVGVIAFGPGNPIDEARYSKLGKVMAQKVPSVKVLDPEFAKGESSAAAKIASGLIQAHPDLKAIYATNGPQATGAASAIRAAGATGKVKLIAYAAEPDQVQALRRGQVDGLLAQSPYLTGKNSVESLVQYVRSQSTSKAVQPKAKPYAYTPTLLITKDNVDDPATKPFVYTTC